MCVAERKDIAMDTVGKGKKVLLFYNAMAGKGQLKNKLDYIIGRFQTAGLQIIPLRAMSAGKTIDEFFAEMEQSEYRQVIVSGGDGTIHVCVNSMIRNNIELPLAIFPAGTANDFAFYFGITTNVEQMVSVALGDTTMPADVGVINDKYFINVAAMGAIVDVSQKTDPKLKDALGVMAYYITGFAEIADLKPINMKFTTDTETFEENIYCMIVLNGRSAGGFNKLSKNSVINDGMLDVMVFREMSIFKLAATAAKVMKGTHEEQESKNMLIFKTSTLRLETESDIVTDIDGEKGEPFPLDFSLLHNRLNVFVPSDGETFEEYMQYNEMKERPGDLKGQGLQARLAAMDGDRFQCIISGPAVGLRVFGNISQRGHQVFCLEFPGQRFPLGFGLFHKIADDYPGREITP